MNFIFLFLIIFTFSSNAIANENFVEFNYGRQIEIKYNDYNKSESSTTLKEKFFDNLDKKDFNLEHLSIGINYKEFPLIDKIAIIRQYHEIDYDGNIDINNTKNNLSDDKYVEKLGIEKLIITYTWTKNFDYLNFEWGLGTSSLDLKYNSQEQDDTSIPRPMQSSFEKMKEILLNAELFILSTTIKYKLFGLDIGVKYINFSPIFSNQAFSSSSEGFLLMLKKEM